MKPNPQAPEFSKREFDALPDESPREKSSSNAGEDYALVIGVNHYPALRPLRGAIADARAFADWLGDPNGGNVPQVNTSLILSTPDPLCPIGPEIDVALENILERAERVGGRRFYFYFSGHGAVGDRASDLALCMADWSNRRRRAALSSDAWLDVVVRSGIFEEVAYFFDCCRVWATRAVGMPPRIDFVTPSVRSLGTRIFLAYATEFQRPAIEVDDSSQGPQSESRGIFTRVLVDVLQRHAASSERVSASFLKKCIEEETEKKAREVGFYQRAEVLNGFADTSGFGSTSDSANTFVTKAGSNTSTSDAGRMKYSRILTSSKEARDYLLGLQATKAFGMGYERFRQRGQVAHHPTSMPAHLSTRLQIAVFPRDSKQSSHGSRPEEWSVCIPYQNEHPYQRDALPYGTRDHWTNLTRMNPIPSIVSGSGNSIQDSGYFFTGNLASGVYVVRYQGQTPRELAVRLFRGWTTLLVIDHSAEPHFEDAKIFLLPYTNGWSLPPWSLIEREARTMTFLNSDLQILLEGHKYGERGAIEDSPMLALVAGHLIAQSKYPDPKRIETLAERAIAQIGPCPDVDALLLRAALVRGGELPRIKTSTPPMLRAGLLAFVEASHKKPDLIPPWSWLEHACIERLVDSPITSWPARTTPIDKNATLEDSIDDFITQAMDDVGTTDARTIARELGVPTLAVMTRMSLTRKLATQQNDRKTSIPPPPSFDDEDGPTSVRPTRLMSSSPPSSGSKSIPKARGSNLPPPGNSLFPAIPGYEIESLIGKGGMGEVYRARRIANGELIAMKIIQENAGISVKGRRRFLREIDTLVVLQHPRIVALLDHGYANGYFYFTMPYYPLGNVADQVKRLGRRSFDQATRIMLDVLEGLAYAHQLGFVHRDIKPQNILVDKKDRFLLADFGLAKEVEKPNKVGAQDMPSSWAITTRRPGDFHNPRWMGTPEFMPPEQFRQFADVRASADVWALARVFYWLLCGVAPQSTIPWRQSNEAFERSHGWPLGLTNLLAMATNDDPLQRPPNAGAFRKMLENIIQGAETLGK